MNVNELPQYKCHKVVRAGKILATARNPNEDAVFLDVDGVVNKWLSAPAGWLNKHNPDIGGYLVAYEDGYLSYSPAAAFEAGYSVYIPEAEIDLNAADFSDALMWLKEGKRVQRAGWNGAGQWVEMCNPEGTAVYSDFDRDTGYPIAPHFGLKNAQGVFVLGWTPSTGDLMATDWQVVA